MGVTKLLLGGFGGFIFFFDCNSSTCDTSVRRFKVILCKRVTVDREILLDVDVSGSGGSTGWSSHLWLVAG